MSAIQRTYGTAHAMVRYRGVRPSHIVPIDVWDDTRLGIQRHTAARALCGVRTTSAPVWLDVAPAEATCRRCRQLWKAETATTLEAPEGVLDATAMAMIESCFNQWKEAGVLDYVLPSEPPGTWILGIFRGTNGHLEPGMIKLDSIVEATAFSAGLNTLAEWYIRERGQR